MKQEDFKKEYEKIKKYISERYNLKFIDDSYGHNTAISYTDKKQKKYYNLNLHIVPASYSNIWGEENVIDDVIVLIGYELHDIPYKSGFDAARVYKGLDSIDEILTSTFLFEKIKYQQQSFLN